MNESTKGSGDPLPIGLPFSSHLIPAAASHGFESVMYQTAPKPKPAMAAAITDRNPMMSLIIVLIGGEYDGCVGMPLGFCVAQVADDLPFGI